MRTWKDRVNTQIWKAVKTESDLGSPVSMMCAYLLSVKAKKKQYNTIDDNQQQYTTCMSNFIKKKRLLTAEGVSYDGMVNFLSPLGNEAELFDIFIYALYLSTHPKNLFALKMYIDSETECVPYSFCFTNKRLIFDHLTNIEFRNEILQHIQHDTETKNILHILTDIDDTVYPSTVGGTDTTYKSKVFYPGVFSFHQQVNKSNMTTFLSARPNLGNANLIPLGSADMSDSGQRAYFLNYYNKGEWPHRPNMMLGESASFVRTLPWASRDFLGKFYGSFITTPAEISHIIKLGDAFEPGMCSMDNNLLLDKYVSNDSEWATAYKHFGIDKFRSFCQLAQIYPEYRFIFIGDTGQGDMLGALLMSHHPSMVTSLIRQVIRHKDPYESLVSQKLENELADRNVFLFSNYIESALILHKMYPGIVSKSNVKDIAIGTHQDFYGRDGDEGSSHIKMHKVNQQLSTYVRMNIDAYYDEAMSL